MAKRHAKTWFRHGNWWRRLKNNRKYRDVLFRYLFREKKDLLELYNALNGSTYKELEELPTPVYIVFYNGAGMQTDNIMLYLSDSFSAGRGSGCLECTCEVLNINRGYNQPLMEKY